MNRQNRILDNVERKCRRCLLYEMAQNVCTPGDGLTKSPLMLVGEAPGQREDDLDKPFQGEAGRLLTKAIEEVKMDREEVWITNSVRCRPPGNRKPEFEEMAACRKYLENEIRIIRPRVIVPLGATALVQVLGAMYRGMGTWRGKQIWSNEFGAMVMPTWHPAYLLPGRNPGEYPTFLEDLKAAYKACRFHWKSI